MAQVTIGGAIKAYLEPLLSTAGPGGTPVLVYRDTAPESKQYPYCTLIEGISFTRDKLEDGGSAPTNLQTGTGGTVQTGKELVQASLWEAKDSETGVLADLVYRSLHGANLNGLTPVRVYGCYVQNSIRLVELAEVGRTAKISVVHHALTIAIHRQL